VQPTTSRTPPTITCDGTGVVSHAGTVLLAELADRIGLTAALSEATDSLRERRAGHDPGRVLVDVAVAIADGAVTISDVQTLADQQGLHGPAGSVASTPTIWRVLAGIANTPGMLARIRQGRAQARDRAWLARGELTGTELPASRATGKRISQVVIDLDATLVTAHSDKEGARGNFKGGFGYHPLGAWLDNTNEALAAVLRPGNAGSNTAADHLTVIDQALAQLPDRWRSKPILIRADGAGYSHALISALSAQGLEFSVGYPVTDAVRDVISKMPAWAWQVACNADGDLREHADVIEITDVLDLSRSAKTCPGMRVIIRRELPHPGATPDAFEIRDGYRYQAFSTNTPRGQLAFLEARHRAHARVRQGHRPGSPALPAPEHQRGLGRARPDRRGPARPDPVDAAHHRARAAPGRTQDAALPAAAHRRPHHPRPAQGVPAPGSALALGTRAGPSVHPPAADPAPGLTASTTTSHHPTKSTETPDQRRRSPLPRHLRRRIQDHLTSAKGSTETPGLGPRVGIG